MFPSQTLYDQPNRAIRYAVSFGQMDKGNSFRCGLPNGNYLGGRKFCIGMGIAACNSFGMRPCSAPLLAGHVARIILGSSQKKVMWITAWRIITSVQNLYGRRDGAIGKFIGHTMSHHGMALITKRPISSRLFTASPWPTCVRPARHIYSLPKSFDASMMCIITLAAAIFPAPHAQTIRFCLERFPALLTNSLYHLSSTKGDARNLGGSCRRGQHVRSRASYKTNSALRYNPFDTFIIPGLDKKVKFRG